MFAYSLTRSVSVGRVRSTNFPFKPFAIFIIKRNFFKLIVNLYIDI